MVMRKLQLPLSQTQKVRLDRALERLQSLSSTANSDASVIVADTIPVNYEDAFLKGHGTSELNGEVVATVCGVVERVDKLVYVRALRARYKPEVGDIIVGRVIEVVQKRWRLEINFNQDAVLMLSSMNMPDGIQRRRTAVDELNMRNIFEENDVVCAEVRNFQHDGGLQLQARSRKYGKLEKGQLLKVDPYLVKRSKHHFHHIEQLGIDLILGCNGFIWVGEHVEVRDPAMVDDEKNDTEYQKISSAKNTGNEHSNTPLEIRQSICRIANAIRVLSNLGFSLTLEVIMETVNRSTSMNLDIHDMLGPEFHVVVAENEERLSDHVVLDWLILGLELVFLRFSEALFVPVVGEFQRCGSMWHKPVLIDEHFDRGTGYDNQNLEILMFISIPDLMSVVDWDIKCTVCKDGKFLWLPRVFSMRIFSKI